MSDGQRIVTQPHYDAPLHDVTVSVMHGAVFLGQRNNSSDNPYKTLVVRLEHWPAIVEAVQALRQQEPPA